MKHKLILALCVLGVLSIGAPSFAQIAQCIDADPLITTTAVYVYHIGTSFSYNAPLIIHSSQKPSEDELEYIFGTFNVWHGAKYIKLKEHELQDLIDDLTPTLKQAEPLSEKSEIQSCSSYGTFRVLANIANVNSDDDGRLAGSVLFREMSKDESMSFFNLLRTFSVASGYESLEKEVHLRQVLFSKKIQKVRVEAEQ